MELFDAPMMVVGDLQEQIATLTAALEKYGRHTNDCSISFSDNCDCGWWHLRYPKVPLRAALSPTKEES